MYDSQGYPPTMQRQTSGKAIAALILSILGLIGFLPLIGSILGIVLGNSAKSDIRLSGGMQEGEGLAQAGVVIGWIGIALAVIGILAFCAIFAFAGGLAALGGASTAP
jgi:hypothetical protein